MARKGGAKKNRSELVLCAWAVLPLSFSRQQKPSETFDILRTSRTLRLLALTVQDRGGREGRRTEDEGIDSEAFVR